MNVVGACKFLVRTIEGIESRANESEFNKLQAITSKDNVVLGEIMKELLELEEKINERDKTEKYRCALDTHEGDGSITFNQDTPLKEVISKLEDFAQCDISKVRMHYIERV